MRVCAANLLQQDHVIDYTYFDATRTLDKTADVDTLATLRVALEMTL